MGEADSACLAVMGEIQVVSDCDDHDVDSLGNGGHGFGDDGDCLDDAGMTAVSRADLGVLWGKDNSREKRLAGWLFNLLCNSDDQNLIF